MQLVKSHGQNFPKINIYAHTLLLYYIILYYYMKYALCSRCRQVKGCSYVALNIQHALGLLNDSALLAYILSRGIIMQNV